MIWNAIITKPAAEKKVVAALTERGIDAYATMETVYRGHQGRRAVIQRPLIRGYVFAVLGDQGHIIHEIDGASRVVSIDGRPAVIDAGFVDALQRAEDKGVYDRTARGKRKLLVGEMVRIVAGPFAGIVCAFAGMKDARKAEVLGTFFSGAGVTMSVEALKLEPVG